MEERDDYPIIPQPLGYKCAGCGTAINEGEFKTFGVCDACWDKGVTEKYWGPKKEHIVTDKEVIKLAENEIESLRKELASLKEENAKLKGQIELMKIQNRLLSGSTRPFSDNK